MAGVNSDGIVNRAQGCLLGQLAGDALGSLVEFETPQAIHRMYPCGVRDLADGGTWDTLAGQPTDDSELVPGASAKCFVEHGTIMTAAATSHRMSRCQRIGSIRCWRTTIVPG